MLEIDKIIRAWKDDDYRLSLSSAEQQALPVNPAGLIEIPQADMNQPATNPFFTSFRILFCVFCL